MKAMPATSPTRPPKLALANLHLDVLLDLLDIPEFLEKKWYIFSGLQGTQMEKFTARLTRLTLKNAGHLERKPLVRGPGRKD